MVRRLRVFFVTGLVVLAPIVVTAYVFWKLFFKIDGLLSGFFTRWPILTIYGRPIPGLGVLAVLLIILLTGMFASNIIGRRLISLGDRIVNSIPLVSRIYSTIKQISMAFLPEERTAFKKAVLIEYPRKGIYSIGFLASEPEGAVGRDEVKETYCIFLPTTPNPTSGFLLLVPKEDVIPLKMSIEDALRLVVSAGTIAPSKGMPWGKRVREVNEYKGLTFEAEK